jgi:hypothetical protein
MKNFLPWLIMLAVVLAASSAPGRDLTLADNGGGEFDPDRFHRHLSGVETCLLCHGSYNLIVRRPEEGRHSLWVNSDLYLGSVHAKLGCDSCHTNIDQYGHRLASSGPVSSQCGPCHTDETTEELSEEEARAGLEQMKTQAGIDMSLSVALSNCVGCHEEEYEAYRESVHGQSVIHHEESDAPFCMDCHGIHYILPAEHERSKTNPNNIPSTCLACHDQADIKARAGLSKSIGESFGDSFHGKRGELGGMAVAVCTNCHGTHAIYGEDDPRSMVNRTQIAKTCGECHEGAQLNFATAFTHQTVSPTEQKGLYILEQIYKWAIFLIIAQFVFFVALDIFQRHRHGRKQRKEEAANG